MATKHIHDAATYTAATRILSGCLDMTPAAFDATDVGHAIIFRVQTLGGGDPVDAVYWGRIARFVSASSVELHKAGSLPSGNATTVVRSGVVLDQGEQHSYSDYIARVQTLLQDTAGKLTQENLKDLLAAAVADYGIDKSHRLYMRVAGNGTSDYLCSTVLGSYWDSGRTVVEGIEYPAGDNPPTILDGDDWGLYDDGTAQDGSNVKIRFSESAPAASEYFNVRLYYAPTLPEVGVATLPDNDTSFSNVTLLATAYACWALAAAYATTRSSTIAGDAINYGDFSERYTRLGKSP